MKNLDVTQKSGKILKNSNIELGKWGEAIAAQFLFEQGYLIIEKNVRTPDGEIDIVAQKDRELVFVEVKTRRGTSHSYPEESINEEKLDHLEASVGWYLLQHTEIEEDWHLDVVTVIGSPHLKSPQIDWFQNVSG